MRIPTEAEVEGDLIRDRQKLPGELQKWNQTRRSRQRRMIRFLRRSELRREAFEAQFTHDPSLVAEWATFPVTEQREIMSTIDYLRLWPSRMQMRRAVEGVRRGSDYRRKAQA